MNGKSNPVTEDELHAYADGQLVLPRHEAVKSLLARNAEVAARVDHDRWLNKMLRERYAPVLREPVPSRLHPALKRRWFVTANMSRFAGMAAALVLGVGIGATLWRSPSSTMTGAGVARLVADDGLDGFARQSAIAHVTYAPDIERPAQIGPARERELGEWVSHSLGTDVVPPVLTHVGYKLMGGRLLSGGDGPFAQFTYNDAKGERVTLCISHRKLNAQTSGFALYKDGPVKVFHWIAGAYGYSVTGGIDRDELLQVAQDVKFALIADGEDSTTGGENPTISN